MLLTVDAENNLTVICPLALTRIRHHRSDWRYGRGKVQTFNEV